jgi:hypothetical protein
MLRRRFWRVGRVGLDGSVCIITVVELDGRTPTLPFMRMFAISFYFTL